MLPSTINIPFLKNEIELSASPLFAGQISWKCMFRIALTFLERMESQKPFGCQLVLPATSPYTLGRPSVIYKQSNGLVYREDVASSGLM